MPTTTRLRTPFALCLLSVGLIAGSPAMVAAQAPAPKAATPAAAPSAPATPAPDADVKKAQADMASEDPTKIVEKPDAATTKESSDPAVGKQANGMWVNKDGNPTPHIAKDGTLDWFTFSGYRRYGANCLVCHGPDAMGSSYAPALIDSLKHLSYPDFLGTVAAGKQDVSNSSNLVMPSFGDNKNVQCYINDIYVYIRARATDQLDRQRPSKHEEKPKDYADAETACLGF
ncbi:c-type cytochrome, methanol metabolism-related [Beijerinckia sp. L45]|uniref:c-type cytochrome, methanol metabolism-related n=1 Tax=Beijerinckia sp. L45 TaxID=1641855 RepID=UPI0034CE48CE